ncbi:MAG: S49 family peptidase [Anaerolineae bacterium]|nr:S49 family peptidase [Anaerolineae bacterium]
MDEQKVGMFSKGRWLLLIVLPLVMGILLSIAVPQPIIGLIYFNDAIYDFSAKELITQLTYARDHPEVRAVVIVLNSPGGTVVDTEAVYMEIARLREKKPVITLIEGMAASGGYYVAVGTDYIIAKPSSEVGNVGVLTYLPDIPSVEEDLYSTGPYKLWGSPRDTVIRELEMIKQGFLQAVLLGRGKALKTDEQTILRGQIWLGSEALRMGLVDQLGSLSHAIEKAAAMARVSHYRSEDLRPLSGLPEISYLPFFVEYPDGRLTSYPRKPGIYLLYIPTMEGAR